MCIRDSSTHHTLHQSLEEAAGHSRLHVNIRGLGYHCARLYFQLLSIGEAYGHQCECWSKLELVFHESSAKTVIFRFMGGKMQTISTEYHPLTTHFAFKVLTISPFWFVKYPSTISPLYIGPTPAGVPVQTKSPGERSYQPERCSTSSSTE